MGGIKEMWQNQDGSGEKGVFESCCLWRWHSEEKGMCGISLVPQMWCGGGSAADPQWPQGHFPPQNIIPRDFPHHTTSFPAHKLGQVVEGDDNSGRAGHQSEQISAFLLGFFSPLSLFAMPVLMLGGGCVPCRRTISGSISGSASSYSGSSSRSRSLSRSLSRSHSRSSSASASHSPSGSRKSRYSLCDLYFTANCDSCSVVWFLAVEILSSSSSTSCRWDKVGFVIQTPNPEL